MIYPHNDSRHTFKITFDYPNSKFHYTMTDLTMDGAMDFCRQFGQNCPLITIKKVQQVSKRLRSTG